MNKVLVLGANGSLGKAICKELANNKIIYFGQTRSKKINFSVISLTIKILQNLIIE